MRWETGERRRETGDGRQKTGDRRWETREGDGRKEAEDVKSFYYGFNEKDPDK